VGIQASFTKCLHLAESVGLSTLRGISGFPRDAHPSSRSWKRTRRTGKGGRVIRQQEDIGAEEEEEEEDDDEGGQGGDPILRNAYHAAPATPCLNLCLVFHTLLYCLSRTLPDASARVLLPGCLCRRAPYMGLAAQVAL
jgi:hypothetical protein